MGDMTAFNVVRFKVKPGNEQQFVDAHRRCDPRLKRLSRRKPDQDGDQTFCFVGEWRTFQSIATARPQMIAFLDGFRDMLEDLGSGLGVTDPVSGQGKRSWQRRRWRKKKGSGPPQAQARAVVPSFSLLRANASLQHSFLTWVICTSTLPRSTAILAGLRLIHSC